MKLGSTDDLNATKRLSTHRVMNSHEAVNGSLHHNIIANPAQEMKTVN